MLGIGALARLALAQTRPRVYRAFTNRHAPLPSCRARVAPPTQTAFKPLERDMTSTASTLSTPDLREARVERQRIADMLALLAERVSMSRQLVHAGQTIYRAGDPCAHLYVLNTGCCKVVNNAADGRAQVVGLLFRGDWIGFDGIADGRYRCDAVALDTGELWALRYDALLAACAAHPPLMALLHGEMSRTMGRDRDALMSLTTLPADARVAEFLRAVAGAHAGRGLRDDQITLRMTRAEIGNYLGLTLESVSRALSRLAREHLIGFADGARREIRIPDVGALASFVGGSAAAATLQ
jgi:CRP/FNR family transcriptional regulator, anaerobic regulatory protein